MDSVTLVPDWSWFWFGLLVVVVVARALAASSLLTSLGHHKRGPWMGNLAAELAHNPTKSSSILDASIMSIEAVLFRGG
jgi:hypothetical protein